MIDLHLLQEQFDTVKDAILKKEPQFPIDKLLLLSNQLRQIRLDVENLRSQRNKLAQTAKVEGLTEELRIQARAVGDNLKIKEEDLKNKESEFKDLYLSCPNLASNDVPSGNKEQNLIVKEWGQKPRFIFDPKNHVELGTTLNWFDFEAAARMAGSHFALYKDEAVKLVYALALYMFNHNIFRGYRPILPPYLVNEKALIGASNFPRFKDNVYTISEDSVYLIPTAEVNLTNLYADHIFSEQDLPVRLTSWTSCFRREAGGYGATERGLIRIHQFEKVELYTLCTPQAAKDEQERMLSCAEEILQKLGLHYRISLLAGQDCSFPSAKTYDIEIWMPGQKEYKEVSSVSNCTDFQARRSAIRFRKHDNEKTSLVYTLNGSSLAIPRLMAAFMETYQQEDGTIFIPEELRSVTITL